MEYRGRYKCFDTKQIVSYPVAGRSNKVKLEDLMDPGQVGQMVFRVPREVEQNINLLAKAMVGAREKDQPLILFTGAHLIKNGLSPLLADLVKRGLFTLLSGTAASSIHDFELGLMGETSEYVPRALEKGEFGMAFEFNYINAALSLGNRDGLGYGESIGRLFHQSSFLEEVTEFLNLETGTISFKHPELSLQALCYEYELPMTIHAGIGTDVIDQHAYFDGEAKGGCSGRDFLIYAQEISNLSGGGVVLNIGSAVTGPEVFLKAASMAANTGKVPHKLITANFDLRPYTPQNFSDEKTVSYYYRDQKSIVSRVPEAYGGKGYYIEGNQKETFPLLYKKLLELI